MENLDSTTQTELWEFWERTNSVRPRSFARELFPDMPSKYVIAAKNLGHYAANKATAMKLREEGSINRALYYEALCDRIYNELPEFARW